MKGLLIATIVSLGLILPTYANFNLNGDFITGFESGIFLRDNENIYEEYGCTRPKLQKGLDNLDQIMGPVKLMGTLIKDQNVQSILATVEVFIESLSNLLAVFTGYDGGDFCQGLIFGSTGAQMLTNVAKTLVAMSNIKESGVNTGLGKKTNDQSNKGTSSVKGKVPSSGRNF